MKFSLDTDQAVTTFSTQVIEKRNRILCPCCGSPNLNLIDRYLLSDCVRFDDDWQEIEPEGFYANLFCGNCGCKIKFEFLILANDNYGIAFNFKAIKLNNSKKKRISIKASTRYQILKRDNHQCQSCGATVNDGAKLEIDHIKPVSKGGTNDPDNLQVLCKDCNLGKSDNY